VECAIATAAMFSLRLVVEAEACSAYQSVVGEIGCKPDQATMVVPRVKGGCRCSGGGVSDGRRGGSGGGRFGGGALEQLPEAGQWS
jgi:hypothetical protein